MGLSIGRSPAQWDITAASWREEVGISQLVLVYFLVVLGCGVVAAGLWSLYTVAIRGLLPPQRQRAVPWGGVEILIALLLMRAVWPLVLALLLKSAGFFSWLYGDDFRSALNDDAAPGHEIAQARWLLWMSAIAFPFLIVTGPALLRFVSGTRLYQLRLTTWRLGQNLALGFLGWVILTPLVFGLNVVVGVIHYLVTGSRPEAHPLTRVLIEQPMTADWILVVFAAVVAAPLLEELLFRGMLQPWLERKPWGGAVALVGAVVLALYSRVDKLKGVLAEPQPAALLYELTPALFVLLMVPGYFLARRLPRPQVAGAIYGTALLFAAAHSFAWPSPVALFVLALGLGVLAYRTQSLVGPMVIHALFNGVTVLLLVIIHVFQIPLPR